MSADFERLKERRRELTVFYTNYSTYEGEPARLYRTPGEIRRDINTIKTKIEETGNMLNIRNILTEMISECAVGDPERWLPALRDIVDEAEDTLDMLKEFKETLDELMRELKETKWALGM